MRLWVSESERRPDPAPARTDARKALLAGTAAWIVALLGSAAQVTRWSEVPVTRATSWTSPPSWTVNSEGMTRTVTRGVSSISLALIPSSVLTTTGAAWSMSGMTNVTRSGAMSSSGAACDATSTVRPRASNPAPLIRTLSPAAACAGSMASTVGPP